jgi:hypothetical protein
MEAILCPPISSKKLANGYEIALQRADHRVLSGRRHIASLNAACSDEVSNRASCEPHIQFAARKVQSPV